MTTPTPAEVEIAEVLLRHQLLTDIRRVPLRCNCGWYPEDPQFIFPQHRKHVAQSLAASPALADLLARVRGEALREAADHVEAVSNDQWGQIESHRRIGSDYGQRHAYNTAARILRDRADRQEQP